MEEAAVGAIFIGTLGGLYFRPSWAKDWHVALAGALLAWLVGPLSLGDGLRVVRDAWGIEAFFLGLMLLGAAAEAAGLYQRIGSMLARARTERGRLIVVMLMGALITAILSNDATPLVLTPAVFVASQPGTELSVAFGATFAADGASMLLPISNPVALLFYGRFGMHFGTYVARLLPAGLAGIVAMGAVMALGSGDSPEKSRRATTLEESMTDAACSRGPFERVAIAAFLMLACAYVGAAVAGVNLGLVALAGGVSAVGLAAITGSLGLAESRRHVSPGLLVFVAALFLLVACVSRAGLLDWLSTILDRMGGSPELVAIAGAAVLGAALSNLMNNWPAAVVVAAAVAGAPTHQEALVAGAIIGCTVGANFSLVGSLSTTFWLTLLRQRGVGCSATAYAKRAFLPTLAGVVAACLVGALGLLW